MYIYINFNSASQKKGPSINIILFIFKIICLPGGIIFEGVNLLKFCQNGDWLRLGSVNSKTCDWPDAIGDQVLALVCLGPVLVGRKEELSGQS